MSRICELTGKKKHVGNNVSHAQNKTKRTWLPNLQTKKFFIPELNRSVKLTLSANAIRTIKKKGGIAEAIKQSKDAVTSSTIKKLKKALQK